MKEKIIRLGTMAVATLIAVIFILLVDLFPTRSLTLLRIETLVIPIIYIIGYEISEIIIKKQHDIEAEIYQESITKLFRETSELNETCIVYEIENQNLKKEINLLKRRKNGKKSKKDHP